MFIADQRIVYAAVFTSFSPDPGVSGIAASPGGAIVGLSAYAVYDQSLNLYTTHLLVAGQDGIARQLRGQFGEWYWIGPRYPSITNVGVVAALDVNHPTYLFAGDTNGNIFAKFADGFVSFAADILPLFLPEDFAGMQGIIDLSDYNAVKSQAIPIYNSLLYILPNSRMPCYGRWPSEQIALFKEWMEEGTQP